jgi:phenylacetate-CoA ligase
VNDFKRETELIDEFKAYFGHDAVIKVEYVNDVPLLASGKRKKVMNLMQSDLNFQRNQNAAV